MSSKVLIGKGDEQVYLYTKMLNRHGLIAGATGTGKTISLKVLAEQFSSQGIPVFLPDVKGDISGFAVAGAEHPKITERIEKINITDFEFSEYPTVFWDIFGKQGHPIRTTISDMGPVLLSRLLDLSDTQDSILNIVFQIADDEGFLLYNLDDLKAILQYIDDHKKELSDEYGRMTTASISAIQRELVALETSGADFFFNEPALNLFDLMRTSHNGKGHINILHAKELILNPKLYSTFLLWLLSELYETLPEVGDQDKPRLVLFFDEAHLMFDNMPDALLDKIKQIILLIRSKGVGIFFITQNPKDINEDVRGQLGNRIQHALRAYSPKEKKAIKSIAESMPENTNLDLEELIPNLGVGEAIVSILNPDGIPTVAQHTLMSPPESQIKPLDNSKIQDLIKQSSLYGQYEKVVDRYSAFEKIKELKEKEAQEEQTQEQEEAKSKSVKSRGRQRQGVVESMIKSTVRAIGSQVGRQIVRGILGSIMKKK